jgi:hypothetical protein
MSGETVEFQVGPNDSVYRFALRANPVSFWRRLWFVASCIPRYLISGSVEVP